MVLTLKRHVPKSASEQWRTMTLGSPAQRCNNSEQKTPILSQQEATTACCSGNADKGSFSAAPRSLGDWKRQAVKHDEHPAGQASEP